MDRSSASPVAVVSTTRFEALSDAIFAIAATLLILDIVPRDDVGFLEAVFDEWPSYLAYVVSFASVGALWLEHHTLTHHLATLDPVLLRMNLLHLLVVAFLPFPTHLVGEHISESDTERIAVTLYGLTLLAGTATLSWMWRHARRRHLLLVGVDDDEARIAASNLRPWALGYAALLVVGLVSAWAAVIGYLVVAIRFLLPLGLPRRSAPVTSS